MLTQNPSRIFRIDPKTLAFLGRPVQAPKDSSTLVAGDGSLWVDDPHRQALVRMQPTAHAPSPVTRPVAASKRLLQNGPVPVGRRLGVRGPGWSFSLETHEPGWIGALLTSGPGQGAVYSVHDLEVGLLWFEPSATFGQGSRLVPLKKPRDFVTALRGNRTVTVTKVEPVRIDGQPALRVDVVAHPRAPYPKVCGGTPCTLVAPMTGYTYTLTPGPNDFLLRQEGAKVLILNLVLVPHASKAVVARAERLLDSVRFTS